MTRCRISIVAEAEQDLIDIFRYVAIHDSPDHADYVLDQLEAPCQRLGEFPLQGHIPPELERIGVTDFREIDFKPYRVIYEVIGHEVFVHDVVDGRRDLQTLLARRVLR